MNISDEVHYKDAVCRVSVIRKLPHGSDPYTLVDQGQSSGTAFFVKHKTDGKVAIVTCAHVIEGGVCIRLELLDEQGSILSCGATVKKNMTSVDLALLELDPHDPNKTIFSAIIQRKALVIYSGNLSLEELKKRQTRVCGYQLSDSAADQAETDGHVARLKTQQYAMSNYYYAVINVTNRINPGFSGAPLIIKHNDRFEVIGVIHQQYTNSDGENSAVPWFYLNLLLIANEKEQLPSLRGLGDFLIEYQYLQSDDLREYLGMVKGQTGVLITRIPNNSILKTLRLNVQAGDIILKVNRKIVSNEGNIQDDILRVPLQCFSEGFHRVELGQKVELEIGRSVDTAEGKKLSIFSVQIPNNQVLSDLKVIKERHCNLLYFAGGVTFISYSRDNMTYYLRETTKDESKPEYIKLLAENTSEEITEAVFMLNPFNHRLLEQYNLPAKPQITHINDIAIRSLYHLKCVVESSKMRGDQNFKVKTSDSRFYWFKHCSLTTQQEIAGSKNIEVPELSNLCSSKENWRRLLHKVSIFRKTLKKTEKNPVYDDTFTSNQNIQAQQ